MSFFSFFSTFVNVAYMGILWWILWFHCLVHSRSALPVCLVLYSEIFRETDESSRPKECWSNKKFFTPKIFFFLTKIDATKRDFQTCDKLNTFKWSRAFSNLISYIIRRKRWIIQPKRVLVTYKNEKKTQFFSDSYIPSWISEHFSHIIFWFSNLDLGI